MLAPLELRGHQGGLAPLAEGRPVVREVLAFEALAPDLLRVQAVDDRVVDLLEKVTVDALVDRPRDAIGIDQQHGDTRVGGGGAVAAKPQASKTARLVTERRGREPRSKRQGRVMAQRIARTVRK